MKPFYHCFSFPSTLSVYFCMNIIPLFHKWGRIKLMVQDWWQKSHLFFIKLFEAKSSCRVAVGQFSENNTSTQAMAVVDIWEPNATMASTFFCSFDALAFEHTLVTFHCLIKVKKKRNIFYGTTELSLLFHLLWTQRRKPGKTGFNTMMYPLTETRLPLCFSQRSLVFHSVFSLQILVFLILWRTRYSTRLRRLIRLSVA